MSTPRFTGAIAWMARNKVAANLLMAIIVIGGLLGVSRTKQEVFPEFSLDIVTVGVPYPGASPAEVEQGITLAVEEQLRGLDGVKRVTSTSSEGGAAISAELLLSADPDQVLNDAKSAVDRITTFPEEAEEPQVTLASRRAEVISIVLSGEQDRRALHGLAEEVRADLLRDPEITQVEIMGAPPLEISIEVPRENLEAYGLTLDDVARAITASSLELPGGSIETGAGDLLVRVSDRKLEGRQFADVIIRGTPDGDTLTLGEIASITDGFADTDQESFFNGEPAMRVTAYRIGDETPSSVATAVKAYATDLDARLPDSIEVSIWRDDSVMLDERIDLLVRNAQMGLVLVVLVLALFLDLRLAFWVALGIPISFLGSFLVGGPLFGASINMVSLFALIITLGIVVDDAIVVGENAWQKMERGMSPVQATITGAREMAVPVTFAVLTTVAAFAPLFFVPGVMGKIFGIIPAIVVSVLLFSLVEGFFILPAHLAHDAATSTIGKLFERAVSVVLQPANAVRNRIGAVLQRFIHGPYKRFLAFVLEWRYATMGVALASFFFAIGLVGGGHVPFSFFPKLEGDLVTASARLPYGAPIARTKLVQAELERSLAQTIDELGASDDIKGIYTRVGEGPIQGGPGGGGAESGSHLVTVEVNLVGSTEREFSSKEFGDAWRAATPALAGLEAMTINASSGPGAGAAVDVQLSHGDTAVLAEASAELAETLRAYSELADIENSYAAGKPQLDLALTPNGRTLGLSSSDIARQLRGAFYGAEALREQRGRNEMKVMVRLPEEQRVSEADLEDMMVRTPAGAFAPLGEVARVTRNRAPTEIVREDGRRTVNVKAELAPGVKSNQEVMKSVKANDIPALKAKYPGLGVDFVGQQRSQAESFASLGQNYIVALFVIYALLAIPFRSYTQPFIIMSAIPFGFVGAVFGHLVMGYELSIISIMGIIALSGVVVNDSLVLIDAANRARAEGDSAWAAIIHAGTRRFRPILLTSLTTFFGLMPMIFETSMQARFLIPMAISLGFGVLFATVIALLIVPALYLIIEDGLRLVGMSGEPEAASDEDDVLEADLVPAK
jgi:multidrug efflux pump subunit AcrB